MNLIATRPRFTWRLRSRSLALGDRTLIMAILNITPDSFSGDGVLAREGLTATGGLLPPRLARASTTKLAIALGIEAIEAGADILDLGAESTRPGASPLEATEEQDRLLPVLEGILALRPDAILSVDTYHAATALAAAKAGAEIINDVSGLTWDEAMPEAVAATRCGLVLMHTRGRPSEWATLPAIPPGKVVSTVYHGLCDSLLHTEAANVCTDSIVADPGFGFGKRGAENIELLQGLNQLHQLGRPLLIGLSRKRFLGDLVSATTQTDAATLAQSRRVPTLAANTAAILSGAHILRVHDVQATREAAAVADALLDQTGNSRQ